MRLPAALLAALLLAGCGPSSLGAAAPSPSDGPVDGPPPDRLQVAGVDMERAGAQPVRYALVDEASDHVLLVPATTWTGARPTPCDLHSEARVLAQDAERVELAVYLYRTVERLGPDEGCSTGGAPATELRVDLGSPLADRRVDDGEDDDEVPPVVVDPRRLLAPSALPSGYRGTGTVHVDGGRDAVVPLRRYTGPAGAQLELFQGAPDAVPMGNPALQLVAATEVRGRPARFVQARGFDDVRCLRWSESADVAVALCTRGNPAPLGVDDLRPVAEGLRPPD